MGTGMGWGRYIGDGVRWVQNSVKKWDGESYCLSNKPDLLYND